MTNTLTCKRCKKTLITEEFDNHSCHIDLKDVQNIVIDYYFEAPYKDRNNDHVIIAKGLDGILYRLVECTHNPPHQPIGNMDKNNREGNRIRFGTLFILRLMIILVNFRLMSFSY